MSGATHHSESSHRKAFGSTLDHLFSGAVRVLSWAPNAILDRVADNEYRDEAVFIFQSGGRLTDAVERDMMEQRISGWRGFGA
jgi:hypothetical protein